MPSPDITLHFLQASRSIRIAWLLEELGLPYKLNFSPREADKAPRAFKDATGNPLGKAPTLQAGGLSVHESGAIAQFLCARYDETGRLSGGRAGNDKSDNANESDKDGEERERRRVQVLQWVHEAEGTFMVHALAVTYARWFVPADSGALAQAERGMSGNVLADLDYLERELAANAKANAGTGGWLVGDSVTAADVMMHFSVQFILARGLGTRETGAGEKVRRWGRVRAWLARCEETPGFRRAVKKSGYTLFPEKGVTWKAEDKKAYEQFMAGSS